jgi:uncharacterized protein
MEMIQAGKAHTTKTLKAAFDFAQEIGGAHVVVATTFGDTGAEAAKMGKDRGIPVTAVTHNAGFKTPGKTELLPEHRDAIEADGAKILTGTMVFRGIGSAFRKKFGTSDEEITASVLRMFGQGMKVCVEIAAMASDAGLVPPDKDIVCVAGTGRGADTAVWIHPASSNSFFDIKIRRVIAKPEEF